MSTTVPMKSTSFPTTFTIFKTTSLIACPISNALVPKPLTNSDKTPKTFVTKFPKPTPMSYAFAAKPLKKLVRTLPIAVKSGMTVLSMNAVNVF